jgi:hypothetical protein
MEMPRIPTWDGRTAKSAGITSATLPQGKIVQMAQLDQLVLQRLRSRPVEPDGKGRRLPVGSLEDHHALQGELFFAEVVPDHEATAGISGAIHITGFTSFNGRDCERYGREYRRELAPGGGLVLRTEADWNNYAAAQKAPAAPKAAKATKDGDR